MLADLIRTKVLNNVRMLEKIPDEKNEEKEKVKNKKPGKWR